MTSVETTGSKLSHKAFRALLKKLRRKKKRQLLAQARDDQEKLEQLKRESAPNYKEWLAEQERNEKLWEEFQERERIRRHKEWLIRQELAQVAFEKKKLSEQQEKEKREAQKQKMIEELKAKNLLEISIKDDEAKAKQKKEETLQGALSDLSKRNEPTHNPVAPENYNIRPERERCLFFNKTGCCRFGDRCSRGHAYPDVSPTILIKGMYSHFSIDQSSRDDYDTDMALEFEDSETYQDFKKFYEDVLPEFKKCGRVVQFKVCSNHEPHLRGNVYVQFSREDYAVEAFKKFNGRFYAGKQLTLEFTNVIRWKAAICGLSESKRCPKGNNCNFLHVFPNPNKEFLRADRDLPSLDYRRHFNNSVRSNNSYSSQRSNHSHRSEKNHHRENSSSRSRSQRTSSPTRKYYNSSSEYSSDERDSSLSRSDRSRKEHRKRKHRSWSRSTSGSPDSSSENRKHRRKHKKKKKKKKKKKRSSSNSSTD